MRQEQFLDVVPRDEAERRFREAFERTPLPPEVVPVASALGRVLAAEVASPIDVPGFSRSNFDGFAVRAADTFGAEEERPRVLRLQAAAVATGAAPATEVGEGEAVAVATGAVIPRGADAVVPVEETDASSGALSLRRAVAPGAGVAHAGSDIARGEVVLRAGERLTSRETGLLASLGLSGVEVVRRPRVAVVSTGDEIVAAGDALHDGQVYDSNRRILADAVREAGGEAVEIGIVRDEEAAIEAALERARGVADLVLFSGGTSKGTGDLCYRVVARRGRMLFHGVALKPGKPLAIAAVEGKPVALLPGFPTSAVFTFHEFLAPWIRSRAGLPPAARRSVRARLARAVVSERGRTEYDLVHLVEAGGLVAWPMGKGSGSLTTFARADGFHAISAAVERLEAGEEVEVTLLGPLELADLVVIGSHCTGLDLLLSLLRRRGITSKTIAAGSTAGLEAVRRGECDIAGIHLFDAATGTYNRPFVEQGMVLLPGYGRRQGVVSRDGRAEGRMVNRNRGSGTRALIDSMLKGRRPEGYTFEVRTHQAVAAAVRAGRADWGVCIENAARGLRFSFLAEERYDFLVPASRLGRPAVAAFAALLAEEETRALLRKEGFLA